MATLRQTVDRLFEDMRPWRIFDGSPADAYAYFPLDVYETSDDVVVNASLPGVKPEDIDISVSGQVLSLRAESKEEHEETAQNYYRRERRAGTFLRQVQLPTEVDSESAEAVFERGVLQLTLPKAEAVKPKSIKVQSGPKAT